MGLDLEYIGGQTPVDEDEKQGLLPDFAIAAPETCEGSTISSSLRKAY